MAIGLDFFLSAPALVSLGLHLFFGLGVAVFFRIGTRLTGRSGRAAA
jgi:hypothetical protein